VNQTLVTISSATISVLTAEHLRGLDQLVERSASEGFRFLSRLAAEIEGEKDLYTGAGRTLLAALCGDEVVGVGGVMPDPFSLAPNVARLRRVYVLPEWRGRGIGRQLVAALEAVASLSYEKVHLRTDNVAAERFYESLGYTRVHGSDTVTHARWLSHASPPP
jgi:GNAT superfamily N-acetyltransferase